MASQFHPKPDGLEAMAEHFRAEGGTFDVGRGWWRLASDCHDALAQKFPDYELLAVKQKFGLLCIQAAPRPHAEAGSWPRDELHAVDEITERFADLSAAVCEQCGSLGVLRESRHVIVTLCDDCDVALPNDSR